MGQRTCHVFSFLLSGHYIALFTLKSLTPVIGGKLNIVQAIKKTKYKIFFFLKKEVKFTFRI